jgi:hypothetical protein
MALGISPNQNTKTFYKTHYNPLFDTTPHSAPPSIAIFHRKHLKTKLILNELKQLTEKQVRISCCQIQSEMTQQSSAEKNLRWVANLSHLAHTPAQELNTPRIFSHSIQIVTSGTIQQ